MSHTPLLYPNIPSRSDRRNNYDQTKNVSKFAPQKPKISKEMEEVSKAVVPETPYRPLYNPSESFSRKTKPIRSIPPPVFNRENHTGQKLVALKR